MTAVAVLSREGDRFICRSSFEHREIPKSAGFRWDRDGKVWFTTDVAVASRLSQYADETCRGELEAARTARETAVEASRAASADVELPIPDGKAYLPYQRAGIAAAVSRPNVLFGDEMGLGKTIQAIGVYNADPSLERVLILCPASLRIMWQRTWAQWSTRTRAAAIATGSSVPPAQILIVNYDIAWKIRHALRATAWDLLICDEAHYMKSHDAQRTRAILGKWDRDPEKRLEPIGARRKIFLTGTPIPNRPIEGYSIFSALDPRFRNWRQYVTRYCAGYQGPHGWDVSGASHLDELQRLLRETILIRRLKADVLTELPAKRRAVIEIPANGAAGAVAAERAAHERHAEIAEQLAAAVEIAKASSDPSDYRKAVERLAQARRQAFTEIAKLRHAVAVAKAPYVIQHTQDVLEDTPKVVVFAHHRDVVAAIADAFGEAAVTLTGETPMLARQAAVDRFQQDPTCRVFVGNLQAAGVGITLTAAAHVIFAELDWVPGNMTQAEDRCHRIGQRESVLVQHLVLEGSLDAHIAQTLVEKQAILEAALDSELPPESRAVIAAEPVADRGSAATASLTQDKVGELAATMTDEEIQDVHARLRYLAARCDGALEQDGMGFNGIDTRIGKELAAWPRLSPRQAVLGQKIVRKYRRQLAAGGFDT